MVRESRPGEVEEEKRFRAHISYVPPPGNIDEMEILFEARDSQGGEILLGPIELQYGNDLTGFQIVYNPDISDKGTSKDVLKRDYSGDPPDSNVYDDPTWSNGDEKPVTGLIPVESDNWGEKVIPYFIVPDGTDVVMSFKGKKKDASIDIDWSEVSQFKRV